MKRYLLQLVFTLLLANGSLGQGQWAWMKGDTVWNSFYGQPGLSGPSFNPSCRYAATGWYDHNGGLWMYSGQGYIDLWRYSIADNEWSWVKDYFSFGTNPTYDIQGIASPNVSVGAAGFGSPRWATDSSYLWMICPRTGDMFRFDIDQENWAWMSGPGTGNIGTPVYGIQGQPADSVNPGDMVYNYEAANQWVDSEGNFWLFQGKYGTVWKYSPFTNQWTWMHGIQAPQFIVQSTYSVLGQFDSQGTNTPGSGAGNGTRDLLTWQDSSFHFWLLRRSAASNRIELWEFAPELNRWACHLDEENTYFPAIQCEESTINRPKITGGEIRSSWVDNCNNAYVFLFDTVYTKSKLWRLNLNTKSFTLINSYDDHHFGQQGVLDVANHPYLTTGSLSWTADHAFWYRGSFYAENSTLWKYVPDAVDANFSYVNNSITCEMDFTDESSSGCNTIKARQWDFGDGTTSTEENPSHFFEVPGTYQVTLIIENCSWDIDTLIQTVVVEHTCNIELTLDYMDSLCEGDCLYVTYETNIPIQNLQLNGIDVSTIESIEICPDQTNSYVFSAIGQNGTIDEEVLDVTILNRQSLILVDNQTICPPDSLILTAGTIDAISFLWSTGSTISTTTIDSPGEYWVLVEDETCQNSDTVLVTISCTVELEMPNVFTPFNHDGVNDIFAPIKHEAITDYRLKIVNRWGNLIFETTDIHEGWNGTNNGVHCEAGTYFWVVEFTGFDNESGAIHGNLTLIP